jgi:hypothetical protein
MLRPIRSVGPFEADPVLIVDANAVRIRPVAFQLLKVMAGIIREIAKIGGCFKPVEKPFGPTPKGFELLDACTCGKSRRACIAEAADHDENGLDLRITSSVILPAPGGWSLVQNKNKIKGAFAVALDASLRGHDDSEAGTRAWLKAAYFPAKTPACLHPVTSISAISRSAMIGRWR